MSKNWKQRIREIAEKRPGKLHPMLKGMVANRPQGEAWERVAWQLDGDGDIAASVAVRPMIAMLQWLNSRSLLTGQGKAILKSIDRVDPAKVSLTRDLVKPAAWAFLDATYQRWWESCGINYAHAESLAFADHSDLDAMWGEFGGTC